MTLRQEEEGRTMIHVDIYQSIHDEDLHELTPKAFFFNLIFIIYHFLYFLNLSFIIIIIFISPT